MQYISLAGRACSLFVPDRKIPAGGFPLVLSNDGDMPAANFDALFSRKTPIGFVFLAVPPLDRNREYTPWKAPALSQRTPCFTGEGEEYLRFLTEKLLPEARQDLPITPRSGPHNTDRIFAWWSPCFVERDTVWCIWSDWLSFRFPVVRWNG